MTTERARGLRTTVSVRLNSVNRFGVGAGDWLLADFPDEVEAVQAAVEAIQLRADGTRMAHFAAIVTTCIICHN